MPGNQVVLFNAPGPQGPAGKQGPPGSPGPQGPAGPAVSVTGTGFLHATSSVLDGAARAVNLTSSDVTFSSTAGQVLQSSGTGNIWVSTVGTANTVTPGTPGQVYITNSSTVADWTSLISVELTHGRLTSGTGSDVKVIMGPYPGSETILGAITFGGINPVGLLSDGTNVTLQAVGGWGITWQAGGNLYASSGVNFSVGNTFTNGVVNLVANNQPILQLAGGTQDSQVLGSNLAVTGHVRLPNNIMVNVRDSGNTTDYNLFHVDSSGNILMGVSGTGLSQPTSYVWGAFGGWSLYYNGPSLLGTAGSLTFGSSFSGGQLILVANNTNSIILSQTGTTTTFQTPNTQTSFVLGTNKSGSAFNLQGDAATTILTLTTAAEFATQVTIDQVSAPSAPASGKVTVYVDSADGALKAISANGTITTLAAA